MNWFTIILIHNETGLLQSVLMINKLKPAVNRRRIEQYSDFFNSLDSMLSHFPEPIFPRSISTLKSKGRQFEVQSEKEMIKAYEAANFMDCKLCAYPSYTEYKGIPRYPPNFILADLDLSAFNNKRSLERALHSTLTVIKMKICGNPTVLWTGSGYHIYQPIEAVILEQFYPFKSFEQPSVQFLRYVQSYLTKGKTDPNRYPSFKSYMIAIPGTYNSKLPKDKNEVKAIQRWNGVRPHMEGLFDSFYSYLLDQHIKEIRSRKSIPPRTPINKSR